MRPFIKTLLSAGELVLKVEHQGAQVGPISLSSRRFYERHLYGSWVLHFPSMATNVTDGRDGLSFNLANVYT